MAFQAQSAIAAVKDMYNDDSLTAWHWYLADLLLGDYVLVRDWTGWLLDHLLLLASISTQVYLYFKEYDGYSPSKNTEVSNTKEIRPRLKESEQ